MTPKTVKLNDSIIIQANPQRVWYAITSSENYKIWTKAFSENSIFEGSWNTGDKIKFLDGDSGWGMDSEIAESRPFEYISIRHLGHITPEGDQNLYSEVFPAYENYTLKDLGDGRVEFFLDMDCSVEYIDDMKQMWPKALNLLKDLCQKELPKITLELEINSSLDKVWEAYTNPEKVKQWNFASSDWYCPEATNDLRVGGRFVYTMSAKDQSFKFDFGGTYTVLEVPNKVSYTMDDGRTADLIFSQTPDSTVKFVQTFEAESENSLEMQKTGWLAIMENFKKFIEES